MASPLLAPFGHPDRQHPSCTDNAVLPGGSNPAIRTLFYRLVRLLSLSIIPIFVFDGPNKPLFKRKKRSRGPGDCVSVAMAKRLLRLFGFHIHDAPGEAEAECALLQQQGIVDAVLSEDVDTIMFGCTKTLRNWSAEATRSSAVPTHVSVYDVNDLKQGESGLDREGMVLVALMSGGDYIPEGVPGCGIKLACNAAKAGFGRRLCRMKRSDLNAIAEWREDLQRELRTNESNFFRRKRTKLVIPDEFPDMDVLRYYTHPVVSEAATIEKLRREFPSRKEIDIVGLREFAAHTFDWTFKSGALRLIKILAPSMLNQALLNMSQRVIASDETGVREAIETGLVKAIKSRRTHFDTDATPELRISYIPKEIVRLDLSAEEDAPVQAYGRSGLALNSDDEEAGTQVENGEDGNMKKVFDPFQPDVTWVPEIVAKLGVPLTVEDWEAAQRSRQLAKEKKAPTKRATNKKASDMPTGALDKWMKTTKPASLAPAKEVELSTIPPSPSQPAQPISPLRKQYCPARKVVVTQHTRSSTDDTCLERPQKSRRTNKSKANSPALRPSLDVNPWSIASSQATPKTSRTKSCDGLAGSQPQDAIWIASSPECSPSAAPGRVRRAASSRHESSDEAFAIARLESYPEVGGPFENHYRPQPVTRVTFDYTSNPARHNRAPEAIVQTPKAKPPRHSSDAPNASTTSRLTTISSRPARTRTGNTAGQISIKGFGKNTETTAKHRTVLSDKFEFPELDPGSDGNGEGFQDVRVLGGSKKQLKDKKKNNLNGFTSYKAAGFGAGQSLPFATDADDSLFMSTPSNEMKMTRLYRSTTGGLGFFEEMQVTRADADRIMSQYELENAKRPCGRRMWRESEVTILDLTGED